MNSPILPRLLAVLAVALGAAACETPDPARSLPSITFSHLAPMTLNGRSVVVVSRYRAALAAPNVDHLFPTPPEKVLRRWAQDRLKAGGADGAVRFTIIDASVRKTDLKKKTGLKAAFTKQQSERYHAVVEATVEILDARGLPRGIARARAVRTRTVREDASLHDRERIWFEMTEALMKDFNAEMEKNIRQYLGGLLM